MDNVKLLNGNNLDLLKTLEDNSVDSVVTDPPYGLSFMNKKWDYDVPSVEFWKEVYRVLKPGGHILSFGGTRTYHRMVVNMEDAGFEIRDQIMWIYGSGFPKSHNISKAIDKVEGNERKVIGKKIQRVDGTLRNVGSNGSPFLVDGVSGSINKPTDGYIDVEEPGSENSKRYEGFGTALKPANEPICVARKPLSEKSVAENVLKWGTGGINVDGCRIGSEIMKEQIRDNNGGMFMNKNKVVLLEHEGRFPANIIFECICDEVIKGEKGEVKKSNNGNSLGFGGCSNVETNHYINDKGDIHTNPDCPCYQLDKQSTGTSRFFYVAKVSKKERNMGLDGFEETTKPTDGYIRSNAETADKYGANRKGSAKNTHPTLKPINLLTYLCRLVTPPNGIILDPFMGSGSTGISAKLEGFGFIGMEMDEDYFKIASTRIENWDKYKDLIKK